ncbi:MAG: hypothetical protein ACMUHY_01200 [Thermoplasmatota archaeon]
MGYVSEDEGEIRSAGSTPFRELSVKESEVLGTLIAYPGLNNSQQSRLTSINHSTFVSIRNRLISEGVVGKYNIPSYWAMGGDVIHISMDHSPGGGWGNIEPSNMWSSKEGSIFEVFDEQIHLSMNVFFNFRDLYMAKEEWENEVLNMRAPVTRDTLELSCEGLSFLNFFDHSGLLSGTGGPVESDPITFHERGKEPREAIRRAIFGMVNDPYSTNKEFASSLGMNRQTFTSIKDSAISEHLVNPRYLPGLLRVGMKVIGIFILPLVENAGVDHYEELVRIGSRNRGHIFFDLLSLNTEVILTAHRDFDDYQSRVRQTIKTHMEMDLLSRPPNVAPINVVEGGAFGYIRA